MPVAYASIGTQNTWGAGTTGVNHLHNITGNAIVLSIQQSCYGNTNPVASASIGGVPMTMLYQAQNWWSTSGSMRNSMAVFGMLNPPTGPQTIALTVADPSTYGTCTAQSVSYTGVSAFGSVTNASTISTPVSVTSAQVIPTGSMCCNVIHAMKYNLSSALTAYNQTTRVNWIGAYLNGLSYLIGDAQGSNAATTFSATTAASGTLAVSVPLLESTDFDTHATTGTSFSSIPHSAGDLLVMFAHSSLNNTSPAIPAAGGTVPTWTLINNTAGTGYSNVRTAWAVGTGSSTSGVWTSADMLLCAVIKGADTTAPIGGKAVSAQGIGVTMTAPAVTLTKSDGTSKLLHYYGVGDGVNGWAQTAVIATPATGYSRRMRYQPTSLLAATLNTKDVTTTDGAVAQTKVGSTWYTPLSIEVLMASSGVPTNQFFQMF